MTDSSVNPDLDNRQERILAAVVDDYVETAEPVGSASLLERHALGIGSATLRSEMANLSERGLLVQLHTSSGRIPSNSGYRYYVNQLMQDVRISDADVNKLTSGLDGKDRRVEAVLEASCQVLADITGLPAMATPPVATIVSIHRVFLSPITPSQTLLVLLYSNGRSENRILNGFSVTAQDAWLLADELNLSIVSSPISVIKDMVVPALCRELFHLSATWSMIIGELRMAAKENLSTKSVFVQGSKEALQHPEFQDVERFGHFLMLMQERAALLEMLSGPGNTLGDVRIGNELGSEDFGNYSMVTARYMVSESQHGVIGVLGPTRMRYPQVLAAVKHVAKTVGSVLQRLTFSRD